MTARVSKDLIESLVPEDTPTRDQALDMAAEAGMDVADPKFTLAYFVRTDISPDDTLPDDGWCWAYVKDEPEQGQTYIDQLGATIPVDKLSPRDSKDLLDYLADAANARS